jgi:thioredoxin 1
MTKSKATGKVIEMAEIADPDDISSYVGGDKRTVVLFEMTGCPFCRRFQSEFQTFIGEHTGDCALLRVKLDAYDNPLWEKYGIEAVPTVIAFAKGEIVARADSVPGVGLSTEKWSDFCACF